MSLSMDLSDIPEVLVMVSKYLTTEDLARAVRVSRHWYRHLHPELWSCVYIIEFRSRFGNAGPQFLRSLIQYGHHIREFCVHGTKPLDLLRPRLGHLPGNDFCPLSNLTKLILLDYNDRVWPVGPDNSWPAQQRLIGLILRARADFELVSTIQNEMYNKIENEKKNEGAQDEICDGDEDEESDYSADIVLPPVEDEETFDDYWDQPIEIMIHPTHFDPMMHLLRHNCHLHTLTVHHFPSWSEQAIRAICRGGLPVLQELDLGSEQSTMVSTRLMRILLDGLTPKLKKLNFWIAQLIEDDSAKMQTPEGLANFWHQRYLRAHHDSTIMKGVENMSEEDRCVESKHFESYELKELSIGRTSADRNERSIEQVGAIRSLVPFLRRCHRLERLAFAEFSEGGGNLWELTSTLHDFCPQLNAFKVLSAFDTYPRHIPDQIFEQLLLAARRGLKNADLRFSDEASLPSIQAFMGTADSNEIETNRRLKPMEWISYPPSGFEKHLATLEEERQSKEATGVAIIATRAISKSWPQVKPKLLGDIQEIVIRPRLQILETLNIAGCPLITSRNIQTILCSCPVLRVFVAISGRVSTLGPFLTVQHMKRPVVSFVGSFSDQDANDGKDEDLEDWQRPKWVCLGLEVLCLRIELTSRPDLRLRVIEPPQSVGGDTNNTDLQWSVDPKAMEYCRSEQRLVYREIGRLSRLRKLRLGQCYSFSQWRTNEYCPATCDFLDTTSLNSVCDVVAEAKTTDSYDLSGSITSRAIVDVSVYQYQSLEFSLASGLGLMLQGTPRLEILEVPEMATRIGPNEIQAMITAWPRLRQLGLRSFTKVNWEGVVDFKGDSFTPTEVPPPPGLPSSLMTSLAEAMQFVAGSKLERPLTERRNIIEDECLTWLKDHCPDVDIKGAEGYSELEDCIPGSFADVDFTRL
ncbi:hypothetical protein EMPS_07337 [Entomortierella parvispora]|uniref:F-box domain-containing protein n=1 Tax=Entomortierella parvispora TaxID=205924 RepID=A0A9P3LY97_9FUNG|nr:hypothetical protein EMPS_07337 [Entomortierella parvispora]